MPIYIVDFSQARERGGQVLFKWGNTFKINSPSAIAAAAAGVGMWVAYLRGAVRADVFCYEVYASDQIPGTQDFATQVVPEGQQRGTLAESGDEPYWPDVALNVELLVPGQRPDRKYWRPGLTEADFVNGVFTSPTLTAAVEAAFNAAIAAASSLVDGQGNNFTAATATRVGNRRLGKLARFDLPTPPPEG